MEEREREERQLERLPTAGNQLPVTESLLGSDEEEVKGEGERREACSLQESKVGGGSGRNELSRWFVYQGWPAGGEGGRRGEERGGSRSSRESRGGRRRSQEEMYTHAWWDECRILFRPCRKQLE